MAIRCGKSSVANFLKRRSTILEDTDIFAEAPCIELLRGTKRPLLQHYLEMRTDGEPETRVAIPSRFNRDY